MVTATDINSLLPQTQCGECGYAGCLPYAQALATGKASINLCAPGGNNTIKTIANLLHIDPTPYLPAALANIRLPTKAIIREEECIGCTKCIAACPVDAVIGSGKLLHTIIASECTGCGLCIEPCPIDCIDLLPVEELNFNKQLASERFYAKIARQESKQRNQQKLEQHHTVMDNRNDIKAKQEYILQAVARVKTKKIS